MNIVVLNGSPKGKYSVSYQYVLYLEALYKNKHTFQTHHVGQNIYKIEKNRELFDEILKNIEKADIIGHSLGGEIGLNMAYYYPERIESLVLIDASPYGERDFLPDFVSSSKVLTWAAMRFFYQTYPIQRYIYLKRFGDRSNFESEEFGKYFALVDRMSISFLFEFMKGNGGGAFSESLGEIDCSALILWGERDEISPLDYGEKLSRELSESVLTVIEGAGHAPFIEYPVRVAEEITGFLE